MAFVYAQQPSFWHFTSEQGLPSEIVYDLAQDKDGYLWLGTQVGLVRYDGTNFVRIPLRNVRSSFVSSIDFDVNGRLWANNYSNQLLYLENDTLYADTTLNRLISSESPIFSYAVSHTSASIYIITTKALLRYDPRKRVLKEIFRVKNPEQETVYDLFVTQGDTVYVARANPVSLFRVVNDKVTDTLLCPGGCYDNAGSHYKLEYFKGRIYMVSTKVGNHSIYYTTPDGLVEDRRLTSLLPPTAFVNYLRTTLNNQVWVCTNVGLWLVYSYVDYATDFNVLLRDYNISDILVDFEGNYWLSTVNGGIFMVPNFQVVSNDLKDLGIDDAGVTNITNTKEDELIVGTKSGKLYLFDDQLHLKGKWAGEKSSEITFILYDKKNERFFTDVGYFFTYGSTIFNYWYAKDASLDPYGNLLLAMPTAAEFVNPDYLNSTHFKGLEGFVNRYHIQTKVDLGGRFSKIILRTVRSRCVWSDTLNDGYWVGYEDDLYFYDRQGKEHVVRLPGDMHIFASTIEQMKDSTIWVGTTQQGLVGIRRLEVVNWFTEKDKLISNQINKIVCEDSRIWLATSAGVEAITLPGGETVSYNYYDGLPSNEINDIAITKKHIWIATYKGITRISKTYNPFNDVSPKIYLTSLEVNDSVYPINNKVYLKTYQNRIRFGFTGISYKSKGNVKYRYRLLGLDTTWRHTNSKANFAYYASLRPGQYTFEVAAVNDDNYPSREIKSITLVIARPYWSAWWFVTGSVLLAVALGYMIYLLRVRQIKRRARRENERNQLVNDLNKARYKSLQTQMNPHFLFNCMNSIQHLINEGKREEANVYLVEFSKLLRGTLEKADALLISLDEELGLMRHYLKLEALRLEDGLDVDIQVEPGIDTTEFKVPALIMHPFLENAILHGIIPLRRRGRISIRLQRRDDEALLCIVEDNGIGREASARLRQKRLMHHKSMGTQLIFDRIDIINRIYQTGFSAKIVDLYNPEGTPAGTRVELVLMNIEQF